MRRKQVSTCQSCRHPKRKQLESDYKSGYSFSTLAKKYDVSWESVRNHLLSHMPSSGEPDELAIALDEVNEEISSARKRSDHRGVISLLGQRRDLLMLKSKKVEEGSDLESRVQAIFDDRELYMAFLDRILTVGEETEKQRPLQ